jgi:hypothetical protein
VDNLYDSDSTVAVRYGYIVHHGRPDSYTARDCNYCSAVTGHSREKNPVDSETVHGISLKKSENPVMGYPLGKDICKACHNGKATMPVKLREEYGRNLWHLDGKHANALQ